MITLGRHPKIPQDTLPSARKIWKSPSTIQIPAVQTDLVAVFSSRTRHRFARLIGEANITPACPSEWPHRSMIMDSAKRIRNF